MVLGTIHYLDDRIANLSLEKVGQSFAWGFATGTVCTGGNIAVGVLDGSICALSCLIHQIVMPFFKEMAKPGTFLSRNPYLLQAIPITLAYMLINGSAGAVFLDSTVAALAYVARSYFKREELNDVVDNSMYRVALY